MDGKKSSSRARRAALQLTPAESRRKSIGPVPTPWLTPEDAAQYCGLSSAKALEHRRARGTGPRFAKPSPHVIRYHRKDLDDWLRSGVVEGER
jgi:hypothetical protein